MKALVFDIRVNSLYSIRIPFTWQSAITYPVVPPSAVIGMIANALQRYKNNKHPSEYLEFIENEIVWAGSRLITPCVIKSYITSAIVKWEDTLGGKFTNALGRQYAYARELQVAVVFRNEEHINDITDAIKITPLTCGDSESPISLNSEIIIKDVTEDEDTKDETIYTEYPIPFDKETKIEEGNGYVYLMHERCKKRGDNFPLVSYMVPIREENKILIPSYIKVRVSSEKIYKIVDIGNVLARPHTEEKKDKTTVKKKRSKKK